MAITIRGVTQAGASSTTTATSRAPALPTGAQVGDLLILAMCWSGGASDTITNPAGWSVGQSQITQTNDNLAVYYRTSDGTASDTPTVAILTTTTYIASMIALGGWTGTPVFVNKLGGAASTTITYPAITPVTAADLLIYITGLRPTTASIQVTIVNPSGGGGTGAAIIGQADGCTNVSGSAESQQAVLTQQLSAATAVTQQTATVGTTVSSNIEAIIVSPASAVAGTATLTGAGILTASGINGIIQRTASLAGAGTVSATSLSGSVIFDSSHAAHGGTSAKFTIMPPVTQAVCVWNTAPNTQIWYRLYVYLLANPTSDLAIASFSPAGSLIVTSAGKLYASDASGAQMCITSSSVPLNAWFRVEGYRTAVPSGSAQAEIKLFNSMDSLTPTETVTSTAGGWNSPSYITSAQYGIYSGPAITGPLWIDDVGFTNLGYLGPTGIITGTASLTGAGVLTGTSTLAAPATLGGGTATSAAATLSAPGSLTSGGSLSDTIVQISPSSLTGTGSLTAIATVIGSAVQGTAAITGAGQVSALVIEGSGASLPSAGQITGTVTQQAGTSPSGAGSFSTPVTQLSPAALVGAGQTAVIAVTQQISALSVGVGQLGALITQGSFANLPGSGQVTAGSTETIQGSASLTGLGQLTAPAAIQGARATTAGTGLLTAFAGGTAPATASLAGAGTLTANSTEILTATATFAGAGSLSSTLTASTSGALAGSGAVNAPVTLAAPAAAAGGGSLADLLTQTVPATLNGAGSLTAGVTVQATATITATGSVNGVPLIETVTAPVTAAGQLTVLATEQAPATLAGAGVTVAATGQFGATQLTGAGTVSSPVTQAVTPALTGNGSLAVSATLTITATASISGIGSISSSVKLTAVAAVAGAGTLDATAQSLVFGTASLTSTATLAAAVGITAPASFAGLGRITSLTVMLTTSVMVSDGELASPATASIVVLLDGLGSVDAFGTGARIVAPPGFVRIAALNPVTITISSGQPPQAPRVVAVQTASIIIARQLYRLIISPAGLETAQVRIEGEGARAVTRKPARETLLV